MALRFYVAHTSSAVPVRSVMSAAERVIALHGMLEHITHCSQQVWDDLKGKMDVIFDKHAYPCEH